MNTDTNQRPWTWREKYELALFFSQWMSLTVMVFIRRDIGLRILPIWQWAIPGFLLWLLFSPFDPANFKGAYVTGWLGGFGIVSALLGFSQHVLRRRDFYKGVKKHSYSRGISVFTRWLPFVAEHNVRRFVDPAFCCALGYAVLRYLSPALGFYLILTAICLRMVEDHVYRLTLDRHLDIQDSMIGSEVIDQTAQHFEKPKDSKKAEQSGPVSTGLSDDLKDLMRRRRS